jgi:hypothetical protein
MTVTAPPRRTVLQAGFAAASVAVVANACAKNEKDQAEEVTPPASAESIRK